MKKAEKETYKKFVDENKEVMSITQMATELDISWNWVQTYLKSIGFKPKLGRRVRTEAEATDRPNDIFAIQWADAELLEWREKHEWDGLMKLLNKNSAMQSNAIAIWKVKEFNYRAA